MEPYIFTIIGAVIVLFIVILFIVIWYAVSKSGNYGGFIFEPPHRAAGRQGEKIAARYIKSVLREDDAYFTNISIDFGGKTTELDNVIVNKFGVFIIEVKNYSGHLYGSEDDYEWTKMHVSKGGNPYYKTVKNPLKQVKREVYILARYLRYYGVSVWVDGYAMIVGASSPVESRYMLSSVYDIDRAIHTPGKKRLNPDTVDTIAILLS